MGIRRWWCKLCITNQPKSPLDVAQWKRKLYENTFIVSFAVCECGISLKAANSEKMEISKSAVITWIHEGHGGRWLTRVVISSEDNLEWSDKCFRSLLKSFTSCSKSYRWAGFVRRSVAESCDELRSDIFCYSSKRDGLFANVFSCPCHPFQFYLLTNVNWKVFNAHCVSKLVLILFSKNLLITLVRLAAFKKNFLNSQT